MGFACQSRALTRRNGLYWQPRAGSGSVLERVLKWGRHLGGAGTGDDGGDGGSSALSLRTLASRNGVVDAVLWLDSGNGGRGLERLLILFLLP